MEQKVNPNFLHHLDSLSHNNMGFWQKEELLGHGNLRFEGDFWRQRKSTVCKKTLQLSPSFAKGLDRR